MTPQERIYTFIELGKDLQNLSANELDRLTSQAKASNSWFTQENVQLAIQRLIHYLQPDSLVKWLSRYQLSPAKPKQVGLFMAGNTPADGFHDFMCVLLSGHTLLVKLNPQDDVLLKTISRMLIQISPAFEEKIIISERLNYVDAFIATVSEKSVDQYKRYFGHLPYIIRTQRKSCAILTGDETATELLKLGNDVFQYFGLGSRNVSKLYVPEGYTFQSFFQSIEPWSSITMHHKYVNNYDYNKSILLVNQTPHQDNGFLLLTENKALVSPVSVVYYEVYTNKDELVQQIHVHQNKLQSIISKGAWFPDSIPFGQAHKPALESYEGNIDTMAFLSAL